MIFTFYKANGLDVGESLIEDDQLTLALDIQRKAKEAGCELVLPTDVICADKFAADAATVTTPVEAIPTGWMGLDIGPASLANFQNKLQDCKTIIWNGPMGGACGSLLFITHVYTICIYSRECVPISKLVHFCFIWFIISMEMVQL